MTYMIDRWISPRILKSPKSILLLGARQVGKSTLIRSLNPDLFINLADEEIFLNYSKDPGKIKREIAALNNPRLIVIDEVQRAPSLLNTIQSILDQNKKIKFVLTGSSARKLKRGGANLLPGRILLEYLHPLSFWEMKNHFDLNRVLQTGALPGIYLDKEFGADVLSTYTTVYLKEEIQAEAVTKNIGSYARFLDVAAESSGQWINYSKMSSDCEIPKETIRRFFTILEDTLIAFRIPAFKPKQTKRRVSQRDRFIFFDVGVRNAILGLHKNPISPMETGSLFEQWILLQCIYYMQSHHKEWKIQSYRTEAGAEVDILLDVGSKYIAVECKYGKKVVEQELKGLRSFEEIAKKTGPKICRLSRREERKIF